MGEAERRAEMPTGVNSVLDRRTVENANANLFKFVKKGQSVLDVGCGSGAITKGILDLVGNDGFVNGIDSSEHLIDLARHSYSNIKNLKFELVDINTYVTTDRYDVVTSARVLQWLSNPEAVAIKMKDLLRAGACLTILDYNHEKIEFKPDVPESMKSFYAAFLQWRKDSGMDNQIADHLESIFKNIGLKNIEVDDHSEISIPGSDSFFDEINIWKKVAESRGHQLVKDNYLTEAQRLLAILEYQVWMETKATYMKLYLKAVTGYT